MVYIPLFLFGIVLFELFTRLRMGRDAMGIVQRSQEALRVLRSPEVGDDEKEASMRRGSAEIFKATLRFAAKFLLVGLVLYGLYQLTVSLFPQLQQAMLESLLSPVALGVVTVGIVGYGWARKAMLARR